MKGLILKDFYALKNYCKVFILILVLFEVCGVFSIDNSYFFISYPLVFGSMVTVTLLNYDEKEKWNKYVQTLPVSKGQYVSGKYITGLILTAFFAVLSSVFQMINMAVNNTVIFAEYAVMMLNAIGICLIFTSLVLPIIFKFGAEKGRIMYLLTIGIFCGLFTMVSMSDIDFSVIFGKASTIVFYGICVVLYILSWILSVRFYKKREIK